MTRSYTKEVFVLLGVNSWISFFPLLEGRLGQVNKLLVSAHKFVIFARLEILQTFLNSVGGFWANPIDLI